MAASHSTPSGASSAALSTSVLPAQSAGAILSAAEDDRRIPGDDGAHHADRLAPRVAEHVLAERDGLALELAGEAAEVADDVGGAPGLGPRLGAQRVAGLLGDDAGELLHPRLHRVGDLLQQAAAVARHHAAPGRERSARGLRPPGRCPPPRRAGRCRWCADCRGFRPDVLAGDALHPAAVDQHLRALRAGRPPAPCSLPLPSL